MGVFHLNSACVMGGFKQLFCQKQQLVYMPQLKPQQCNVLCWAPTAPLPLSPSPSLALYQVCFWLIERRRVPLSENKDAEP